MCVFVCSDDIFIKISLIQKVFNSRSMNLILNFIDYFKFFLLQIYTSCNYKNLHKSIVFSTSVFM